MSESKLEGEGKEAEVERRSDFVLTDGRPITFDFTKITLQQYRDLFKPSQSTEEEDRLISRVCGMDAEEYTSLSYLEWRRLTAAFFARARNPLSDPNSQSVPTSV